MKFFQCQRNDYESGHMIGCLERGNERIYVDTAPFGNGSALLKMQCGKTRDYLQALVLKALWSAVSFHISGPCV